jgi:hypothetical protein
MLGLRKLLWRSFYSLGTLGVGHPMNWRTTSATFDVTKQGRYLPAQWRIQLTIPPWLPEEEVLRAFRLLRGERPKGRKLPKTARPLAVACFVWEQERLEGYRKPSSWRLVRAVERAASGTQVQELPQFPRILLSRQCRRSGTQLQLA